MIDEEWAKAIVMHLTGRPDEPTPMLLKMVADIRAEGAEADAMNRAAFRGGTFHPSHPGNLGKNWDGTDKT